MKIRKEVKIGIFALVILFALYWGFNFLKGKDLFKQNRIYYSYYENVTGIQVSSPIVMKGIKIGSVTKISYNPTQSNVELQMSIKSDYSIPENSLLRITSGSIIGGKVIEMELGTSDKVLSEGAVIPSVAESSFLELAGSEFDYFKAKAGELINQLNTTLSGINGILSTSGDNIAKTVSNLESITTTLDHTLENDMREIAENLNHITRTLSDNSGRIDNTICNIESITDSLRSANLKATVESLSCTLAEVNRTLECLNNAEGSLGLLLNDPGLYDSLTAAGASLASLLSDIEENPRRYVHFSLFGGGKKNK